MKIIVAKIGIIFSCSVFPCSGEFSTYSQKQFFQTAEKVFVARIIKAELEERKHPWANRTEVVVKGTYELIEPIKGAVEKTGFVYDPIYGLGNCALGLMAGINYVFFKRQDGFVFLPTGSVAFITLENEAAKEYLDEIRQIAGVE